MNLLHAAHSGLSLFMRRARAQSAPVGWTLVERLWMLVSGLIVGFWVVRSLGPEQFGEFSAALSVAAVFAGLSLMGLETALVRRFAAGAIPPEQLMRAAAALRLAGSLVYIVVCGATAALLFRHSLDVALIAIVVAFAATFRITDIVGLRLQSENRYREAAATRVAVRVVGDAVRIGLILAKASAIWFAVGMVVESLVAFGLFGYLGRAAFARRVAVNRAVASSLFAEGRPVMVAGLLSALYARVDQLVLFSLAGPLENGFYAAAARLSEAFNVVIVSVSTVAAAHFGRLAAATPERFDAELRVYYRGFVGAGVIVALIVSAFAGPIVHLVFGAAFAGGTTAILRVHALTIILVCASVAVEPWFYHYGKLSAYVPKTFLTLLFSIPAVWLGTRFFGPVGTAAAVVLTYCVSVFFTNALLPSVRGAFRFQVDALTFSKSPP